MTYFELFDVPVQLHVNIDPLRKRFFELSRKYHPDYFSGQAADVQDDALQKSAMLNKAWKTFQSREATIKYVLQEKGLLEEEEKYQLPPDFLMEVMEINEQLMESETGDPSLDAQIKQLSDDIYAPVKDLIQNYNDQKTTQEDLLRVKEYYFKKKYLDRIKREIANRNE